jgi:hypothetical protein
MKSLLLSTVYATLRVYAGSGVFNRIVMLAAMLMDNPNMAGQEKMQAVLDSAQREALNLSSTLIRAIVEVFLLKQQG